MDPRPLFTFHSTVTFFSIRMRSREARMTAIIVSAIHFVNWSISTQTTCSRSEIYREALGHGPSHCLYVSQCYRMGGNIDELWKVLKEISL